MAGFYHDPWIVQDSQGIPFRQFLSQEVSQRRFNAKGVGSPIDLRLTFVSTRGVNPGKPTRMIRVGGSLEVHRKNAQREQLQRKDIMGEFGQFGEPLS